MGKPTDLVQGTLDLLILKTLELEPKHGWAIAKRIQQISNEVLKVQQGSLYPALYRLEKEGWLTAHWAETETGREAKFYALTRAGRRQLKKEVATWDRLSEAINLVVRGGIAMSGIRSWVSFRLGRLLPWLRQSRASAEIRKELDLHLALETDENLKLGMSREEAARLARVTLGNGPLIREDAGAVWSWHWWDACRRGIGLGVRGLRRRVGASLTVVLILALGIGSTTAMFALVDGVLLAPLPYDEPSQLATVQVNVPQIEAQFPVFPGNLRSWLAWRNCRVTCDDLAVLNPGMWTLTGDGDPQVLRGAWVSANFFDLLRVAPGHSQVFHEATESRSATDHGVVLTHALWQRVYRGDPQIVGRLITLDDARLEVIGVLPAAFELPPVEFLHPVAFDFGHLELFRALRYTPEEAAQPFEFNHPVILRMADAATVSQAQSELAALTNASYADLPFTVNTIVRRLDDQIVGGVRLSLWWLFAAVGAVFVVALVNVASVLATRWHGRAHELAIRGAIGARWGHLTGLVFTESVLLAVAGGLAGLLVAQLALRVIVSAAPVAIPRLNEVLLDGRVVTFAIILVAVSAVVCTIIPAWRTRRSKPSGVLQSRSHTARQDRTSHRVGALLVGAEVALTAAVLMVGGLLLVSFVRVLGVDRGFSVEQVVAVDFTLAQSRYENGEARTRFYDALLAEVATAPGIDAVGLSSRLPLEGHSHINNLLPVGASIKDDIPTGNYRFVSPDYVRAMGMTVTRGRPFTEADRGRPVALVTESTAAQLWPGRDPVGQRFHRGTPERPPQDVIGIVADARILGLDADPGFVAYLPYWESSPAVASLAVRSTLDPGAVVASIRAAVSTLDAGMPVSNIRVMSDVMTASLATRRFLLDVTVGFALVGLVLVGLGVFGVVSGSVARRQQEFALRSALGATHSRVVRLIVGLGLRPVVIGLAVGLGSALALTELVRALLFGVGPFDPAVVTGVVGLVLLCAVGACGLPALQVVRRSPARRLQTDA